MKTKNTSEWLKVKAGVEQSWVMSGFLFLYNIDWIRCETTKQANTRIRWRFMDQLEDLDSTTTTIIIVIMMIIIIIIIIMIMIMMMIIVIIISCIYLLMHP